MILTLLWGIFVEFQPDENLTIRQWQHQTPAHKTNKHQQIGYRIYSHLYIQISFVLMIDNQKAVKTF